MPPAPRAIPATVDKKPLAAIPAFYACYLLRSAAHHASLYVGSTPNPLRRLNQHNGKTVGGAARTSRDSLRPWEMVCLVHGFPSKVAALQFEWAWQNAHLTRHVDADERITQMRRTKRVSWRTGHVYYRVSRPRLGLSERLANLHLLLRSSSFARWPLAVTFYSEDVYSVWRKWAGSASSSKVRSGIDVALDRPNDRAAAGLESGVHTVDVTYKPLKRHLEMSEALFNQATSPKCAVCHEAVPRDGSMALVCPVERCEAISHIRCLSTRFLTLDDPDAIVPTSGNCPCCRNELRWIDLVKELSLRMRERKAVDKVLGRHKKRAKKAGAGTDAVGSLVQQDYDDNDNESDDEIGEFDDEWRGILGSDAELSDVGTAAPRINTSTWASLDMSAGPLPEVKDSDWDDADEII